MPVPHSDEMGSKEPLPKGWKQTPLRKPVVAEAGPSAWISLTSLPPGDATEEICWSRNSGVMGTKLQSSQSKKWLADGQSVW